MTYAKIVLGKRGFRQARAPQLLSAELSLDGATLELLFDQFISATNALTGWVLELDSVAVSLSNAQVSGAGITFALATPALEGAVATLDYTAGTVVAVDGGLSLGDFTTPRTVNNLSRLSQPARISGPTIDVTGRYVTVGFDQALVASSPLLGWSAAGVTFDSVEIASSALTLHTSAPIMQGASVTLVYDDGVGTLLGVAGYPVASFSASAVNNSTVAAPAVSGTPTVAASGQSIAVVYDRAIDSATPTDGWTVLVDAAPVALGSGTIAGSTLTLVPASTIPTGATVSLAYAAGTIVAVSGGVAADSYGPTSITNNSTADFPEVSGTPTISASGTELVVILDRPVSGTAVSGWALTVDSVSVTLLSAVIASDTITFQMGATAEAGKAASLTYAPGDITAVTGGLPLLAYGSPIANNSTRSRPTITGTPAVGSNGMTTAVTLNQSTTGLSAVGWTLRTDGDVVPVSGYSVSGNVLTLEHAVVLDGTYVTEVTLQYDAPPGTISASTGGLAMLSVAEFAITNGSARVLPTYTYGTVGSDGVSIVANFSEALNQAKSALLGFTFDVTPGTGAPYTITPDAATYTSTNQITFTFNEVVYNAGATVADSVRMDYDDTVGEVEADSGGADTLTFTSAVVVNGSGRVRPYITAAALQPDGRDVVLTFNEPLNTGVSVTGGFQYKLNGTNTALHGSGNSFGPGANQITHRLANIVYMHTVGTPQVVTVDYTPGAIADVSPGDAMLAVAGQAVSNASTVVPFTVVSATALAGGNGVVLTLSADADPMTDLVAGFTYAVAGDALTVASATRAPSNNQITHLFSGGGIFAGDSVTYGYTPGTAASTDSVPLLPASGAVDVTLVGNTWTPSELPGIYDWWVATDVVKMNQDNTGAGTPSAAGTAVRYWLGEVGTAKLLAPSGTPHPILQGSGYVSTYNAGSDNSELRVYPAASSLGTIMWYVASRFRVMAFKGYVQSSGVDSDLGGAVVNRGHRISHLTPGAADNSVVWGVHDGTSTAQTDSDVAITMRRYIIHDASTQGNTAPFTATLLLDGVQHTQTIDALAQGAAYTTSYAIRGHGVRMFLLGDTALSAADLARLDAFMALV